MFSRFRKIRADRRLWAEAQSLPELSVLTVRWLEGGLAWQPADRASTVDEETAGLVPVLSRLNAAGLLTTESQPGCDEMVDGVRWQQCAAVAGLVADTRLMGRINRAAMAAGLTVGLFHPRRGLWSWTTPVTFQDGEPTAWYGRELSVDDLEFMWRGISPAALGEVVDAWQVTVIDPEVGREDLLWSVLDAALQPEAPADLAPVLPFRRTTP